MTPAHLSVSSGDQESIQIVVAKILGDISNKYNLDLSQDPVAMERIQEAARKAYLTLEQESQVEISLPFISATSAGPIHYHLLVTKTDSTSPGSSSTSPEKGSDQTAVRARIELPDRKPVITTLLMIVTIVVYLIQLLTSLLAGYDIPAYLGLKMNELILEGQYWRFITPVFLHGSLLHLGFNMYALYILGRRIERFYGSLRFLGLYLIAGIYGNLFSFLFTISPSLGSSTAVFGLLGAEGIFIYQHRELFGEQFQKALRQIIQVAAVNILIGLSPGIDNWGHIGGLLGGMVFSWFGGPLFEVQGSPPILQMIDTRPDKTTGLVFLLNLLLLIGFILLIIYLRLS
jgi:rhomboid protease GluP